MKSRLPNLLYWVLTKCLTKDGYVVDVVAIAKLSALQQLYTQVHVAKVLPSSWRKFPQ